mmetsp:Transcript_22771/g.63598  ORF Transcript_22771/g.63598 Transcript_22771/m.63598 type:complete len:234 (-) Transcript_22771:61-762(-)
MLGGGEGVGDHHEATEREVTRSCDDILGGDVEKRCGASADGRIQVAQFRECPKHRRELERLEVGHGPAAGVRNHLKQWQVRVVNHSQRPRDVAQRLALRRRPVGLRTLECRADRCQALRHDRMLTQSEARGLIAGGELRESVQGRGEVNKVHTWQILLDSRHQQRKIAGVSSSHDLVVDQGERSTFSGLLRPHARFPVAATTTRLAIYRSAGCISGVLAGDATLPLASPSAWC